MPETVIAIGVVVVEAIVAAHAAEVKGDGKWLVAIFTVQRKLFGFEGVVVFGVETVVLIPPGVGRLADVEIEPGRVAEFDGRERPHKLARKAGSTRKIGKKLE